jgi:GNAT superfamily N-acetyltransferase
VTSIVRLGIADVARYRTIRLRALQESPDAFGSTYEREQTMTDDEWRERLGRADGATFVAVVNNEDVGLVGGAAHHDVRGDAGLYSMWVAPDARGRGVSTALITAVFDWARATGMRAVRLEVGDYNVQAQRLYARLGFAPTGRTTAMATPREHITEHEQIAILQP